MYRYAPEEREEALRMLFRGVGGGFRQEVLQEAVSILLQDRERLDKLEQLTKISRPERFELDIQYARGETLRHAIDRAKLPRVTHPDPREVRSA